MSDIKSNVPTLTSKEFASNGGFKRASSLTPERRSEIAKKAGSAKGKKGLHKAHNEGKLWFGEIPIDCYVLSVGEEKIRAFSLPSLRSAFGFSSPNSKSIKKAKSTALPTFLTADNLKPYVSRLLDDRLETFSFVNKTGHKVEGVSALFLPKICQIYVEASQKKGVLQDSQIPIAITAGIILSALAQTGVIALVDEASGFQEERARNELQTLLKNFINEDLLKWTQKFPHSFFRETYRIYGWKYREGQCHGPSCLGGFINKYIYWALSPEVHEELKIRNPILENGKRGACFHQLLTEAVGLPALEKHLAVITTLLKLSKNSEEFKNLFSKLFPEGEKDQLDWIEGENEQME